jgi:hypothetical protein
MEERRRNILEERLLHTALLQNLVQSERPRGTTAEYYVTDVTQTVLLNPFRVRVSRLFLSEGFALGYSDLSLSGIEHRKR